MATLLARIMHIPSMVNLQGGDSVGISSLNYGVMHRSLFKQLALWAYNKTNVLTTLTFYQKDLINRQGISRPILVIPFGADRSVFRACAKNHEGISIFKFLHVSNYNVIKDTGTLLRTFALIAKHKNSRLRIIGGQYEKSDHKELCRELGIESLVEFCGSVAYDEINKHYE